MRKRPGRTASLIVSLAILGSRVLGLVREQTFAFLLGAGRQWDAFLAAFQIPNLLRDLFAEGALSTAFTTVFAQTSEEEGDEAAWRFGSLVLSTLLLILGGLCLAGILLSPLLVDATSFGFRAVAGKHEMTVRLTRLLFPFILFISLAAAVMGMLNARYRFTAPALSPIAFNLASIVGGVALAFLFEPQPDWRRPAFGDRGLIGLAFGVLLGGLAQLAVQWPPLWREGFRYRWHLNWHHPRLRQLWRLFWPAALAASAVEVNVLINVQYASLFDGGRSWLASAFRILYFPIGLFGVAVATVTLPAAARDALAHDRTRFGQTAEEALRLSLFFALPAAAGMAALAIPIVRLLFEHGRFTTADTLQSAAALRAYSVGLAGYASVKVLVPLFHALNRPYIPLRVNLAAIGINLLLNALFVFGLNFRHVGVAAATAGVTLSNSALLAWHLSRLAPLGSARRWLAWGAIVVSGSLLAAPAAWLTVSGLESLLGLRLLGRLIATTAAIGVGGAIYAGWTLAWRIPEALQIKQSLTRRWGRLLSL
jgi:putative peptidoglycan lipid II flippase